VVPGEASRSRLAGRVRALLAGAVLAAGAADAQGTGKPAFDGERIRLVVGQRAPLCPSFGCHSPICDDPRVATVTANSGELEAHGVGTTFCSLDYGYGQRRVYQVKVVPPPPQPGRLEEAPAPAEPPPPPPPPSPKAVPTAAPPRPAADPETLYEWPSEDGSLQFGHLSDIPPALRKQARPVTAELSVVSSAPSRPASSPPPSGRAPAPPPPPTEDFDLTPPPPPPAWTPPP